MTTPTSTCWTCGYKWPTGHDGSHSCTKQLSKALKEAEDRIEQLESIARPEAAPRDIAQELIAGLEEVRDMRKCKKCEYPNCFCVQPQPQRGST